MKVEVRLRGIEVSDSLSAYVVRRAYMQFSRFERAIRLVVVRIGDINGPRGGADKRCQVTVRGPALGTISVEELSADAYSAVDLVLARAARAAGRGIEQARASRRQNIR
jgi:ribosome-associated translation inhibitor RaiA